MSDLRCRALQGAKAFGHEALMQLTQNQHLPTTVRWMKTSAQGFFLIIAGCGAANMQKMGLFFHDCD